MAAGRVVVRVPDIGDFQDVEVVEVLVAPGDRVEAETSLITLESDKASLEVPSPRAGVVVELHVREGTLYHYKLESLDVLHNFSVPVFRLKQDAIPGRVITGWFEPTMAGEFDIQCAEICGIGHGLMGARIHIETPEQHAAWVAENSSISIAANAAGDEE